MRIAALIGSGSLARRDTVSSSPGGRAGANTRVAVTRLTLTDFRCYHQQRMESGAESVVLTGPNGAGKTNILEALSFLVPGRGLRRARLDEVARTSGSGAWAVAARLDAPDGPVELGTGLHPLPGGRERRVVKIDGQAARGQAVLSDYLNAVWLTPQMDRLFQEGTTGRRRFLDRLVFGFDPAHAGRVTGYEHAMRERSRLLATPRPDPAWLTALEETMASRGVAVAAARKHMVERLDLLTREGDGAFPAVALDAIGEVEQWLDGAPALAVEDRVRGALHAARDRDATSGGAAVGPHRGDLAAYHLDKGIAAAQCSTGEQKALLISIVLANARLQAAERGSTPLLLLDEVGAHLDPRRRDALFDRIEAMGAQAWMTGTDDGLFTRLRGRARFLHVEDARVKPKD